MAENKVAPFFRTRCIMWPAQLTTTRCIVFDIKEFLTTRKLKKSSYHGHSTK